MNVSPTGRALIERNEGCRLHAYLDVVGVPTIGYGHIEGVVMGQVITQAQADQLLADDLNEVYGPGVQKAIGGAPTTQAQFDAMVSLAYNVGVGGFSKSTVCRQHKEGNYQAAADAFSLWNKAGGKVLAPLTRRRREEAEMYLSAAVAKPAPEPSKPSPKPPAPVVDISPFDRIKAIQVILGVKPDGDMGKESWTAMNAVLEAAGQAGVE